MNVRLPINNIPWEKMLPEKLQLFVARITQVLTANNRSFFSASPNLFSKLRLHSNHEKTYFSLVHELKRILWVAKTLLHASALPPRLLPTIYTSFLCLDPNINNRSHVVSVIIMHANCNLFNYFHCYQRTSKRKDCCQRFTIKDLLLFSSLLTFYRVVDIAYSGKDKICSKTVKCICNLCWNYNTENPNLGKLYPM